jgi:hypothetical protein
VHKIAAVESGAAGHELGHNCPGSPKIRTKRPGF